MLCQCENGVLTRPGLVSVVVAEIPCKPKEFLHPSHSTSFVIIKRERGKRICSTVLWGKLVPKWAHDEASLPPEGPDTQWYSKE